MTEYRTFGKKVVAPPAPAAGHVHQGLPLPMGIIQTQDSMEVQAIKAIYPDFQAGDPVPASLADQLALAFDPAANAGLTASQWVEQELMKAAMQTPVSPNTPAAKLNEVPFASLSDEHRASIQQTLKDAKAFQERMAAREVELRARAEKQQQAAVEYPDIRIQLEKVKADMDRREAEAPKSAAKPAEKPVEAPVGPSAENGEAGGLAPLRNCPCCNWDLQNLDVTEMTPEDQRMYVACLGTGNRFEKCYQLFGGHVQVTFRELYGREYDLAKKQVFLEAKDDEELIHGGIGAALQRILEYRMYMAISRLVIGDPSQGNALIENMPTIDKMVVHNDSRPKLVILREDFLTNLLPKEQVFAAVGEKAAEFERLLQRIRKSHASF